MWNRSAPHRTAFSNKWLHEQNVTYNSNGCVHHCTPAIENSVVEAMEEQFSKECLPHPDMFFAEFQLWKKKWSSVNLNDRPSTAIEALLQCIETFDQNVRIPLTLVTLPISTSSPACSSPPNHGALCGNTVCTILIRTWGLQKLLCLACVASDVRRAYGWALQASAAMPGSDYILRGPPEILLTETSLGEHFRDKLQENSDKTVLIHADTGQKMTQADLLVSSERLAAALQAQGVGPGDVIGVCSENSLEYCIPVLAALYVGATCAPLSAGYTPRELTHAMSLSGPRLNLLLGGGRALGEGGRR
uniref:AMP-dependent synthetase/ligase domain-containing protein n=1 Tax=Timema bartmani TaxID=61472 RepID=A0A7R9F029_9NEOP|nr:unnamed protein product [Timema bartmani]